MLADWWNTRTMLLLVAGQQLLGQIFRDFSRSPTIFQRWRDILRSMERYLRRECYSTYTLPCSFSVAYEGGGICTTECARSSVVLDGEISDCVDIVQGVAQICTLSPTLFKVYFDSMIAVEAAKQSHCGGRFGVFIVSCLQMVSCGYRKHPKDCRNNSRKHFVARVVHTK